MKKKREIIKPAIRNQQTKVVEKLKIKSVVKSLTSLQKTIFIFIPSIIISLFLIHYNTNTLSKYAPSDDEITNIFSLKSIQNFGLPYQSPPKETVNYVEGFPYHLYWEYGPESYLRFPFYFASTIISFNWYQISSLGYLYLILIFLIYYFIKDKSVRLPLIAISLFILCLGCSPWASCTFHFVRYYPFTLLFMVLSQFACCYIYTFSNFINLFKKYLFILVVALIPSLFHQINAFFFAFWLSFISLKIIINQFKTFNFKEYKFWLTILFLSSIIAGIITLVVNFDKWTDASYMQLFNPDNRYVFKAFLLTNLDNSKLGYFILLIFSIFGIISIRSLSKYEFNLFLFSNAAILFSLFAFVVMGGAHVSMSTYAMSRYLLFLHPLYLLIISLLLTAIVKKIFEIIKNKEAQIATYYAVLIILLALVYSKSLRLSQYFNPLVMVEKKDINSIQQIIKKDYVILTDDSYLCTMIFPNNKNFEFRDYHMNINYSMKEFNGYMMSRDGSIYVGSRGAFLKMLNDNKHKLIYLYRANFNNLDDSLKSELKKYYINNPITSDFLSTVLTLNKGSSNYKDQCLHLVEEEILTDKEYIYIGIELINQMEYYKGIVAFQKALKFGDDEVAYNNIAFSFIRLGNMSEALKAVNKTLERFPNSKDALKYLNFIKSKIQGQKG